LKEHEMSPTLALAIAILIIGAVTFSLRLSLIGLAGRVSLPPLVVRALRYVPVAALTALVVPDLVGGAAGWSLLTHNPQLWAGVAAALIAWRTRNVLLTVASGMVVLEVLLRVM
jgi:branched-subunit amino acid transport protein